MKPSSGGNSYRRRAHFLGKPRRVFPIIDCNYQAPSFGRYFGGAAGGTPSSSFLNISRDYFRSEARRSFVAEAAFFVAFAAILALTFISGAIAIIHFLNLPEA